MTRHQTNERLTLAFAFFALVCAIAINSSGAQAQAVPSDYTAGFRYDLAGRLTGQISPDPDGAGPLAHAAMRNTYNAQGWLSKTETGELAAWQSDSVAPSAWSGYTVLGSVEFTYDAFGSKLTEFVRRSDGSAVSFTQFSYTPAGWLECTAVRMNSTVFGSEADACELDNQGAHGPDRITKNIFSAGGRLLQIRQAVGTSLEQAYVTYSYTQNRKQEYVIDAKGNRAKFEYDGFDRLKKRIFPSSNAPPSFNPANPETALLTAGSINTGNYEEYSYDANGNRTMLRKRDGSDLAYTYDNLNRMTAKNVDVNNERNDLSANDRRDVAYTYDLAGSQLTARFSATGDPGIINTYDGFGRVLTATNSLFSGSPVIAYQYDKNGNRTQITHPGSIAFDMTFDGLNRLVQVKRGTTVLAAPSYHQRGTVKAIDRSGAALDQAFGYDNAGRLASLDIGSASQSHSAKVGWDYTRNAASQTLTEVRDNDSYAWLGRQNGNLGYTVNGLNQYSAVGGNAYCYDANGNLTDDGEYVYKYDVENRLIERRVRTGPNCPSYTSGYGGAVIASLHYDPLGRLHEVIGDTGGVTRFLYDGDALVLEYDGSNTVVARYVHGNDVGADDPLVWYPGSGTGDSNVRHLYADPRGSIVLVQAASGSAVGQNRYDEWGVVDGTNVGRFQYTGQVWLDELGMYYYKARIYSPFLGRFMQTDPIGYDDQLNLYAYVGNDPINRIDFFGLAACPVDDDMCIDDPNSEIGSQEQLGPDATTQAKDAIVVTAEGRRRFTSGERIRFPSRGELEQGFRVSDSGIFPKPFTESGTQRCDSGPPRAANRLNISDLGAGESGGHTHGGGELNPLPGPEDGLMAAATGQTAYQISRRGAFAIESTGVGFRVRQLSGRGLSGSERAYVLGLISNWNQHGGGSGKKCTFTPN